MKLASDEVLNFADEIYESFCVLEGGLEHPFQDAWDKFEEKHGSIESPSLEENLVFQAILYALQEALGD